MQYQITHFQESTGTVSVRFWTEQYPDGLSFSIDIPLVNGEYITGEALNNHIMSFAPYEQIKRFVEAKNANKNAIKFLVTPMTDNCVSCQPEEVRGAKLIQGFSYNDVMHHCDMTFQQQLNMFLSAYQNQIVPEDHLFNIRTFDNKIIKMNKSEIQSLFGAVLSYVQTIYAESWAAKDAKS